MIKFLLAFLISVSCLGAPTEIPLPAPGPSHHYLWAVMINAYHGFKITVDSKSTFWNNGTPNYKMMWSAATYMNSIHFGDAAMKKQARDRVLVLVPTQSVGHMNGEQFAVDPHSNFWVAAMVVITQAAWESNDAQVKSACTAWWSAHFYWLDQVYAGPVAGTRLPGVRLKGGLPGWGVDSEVYKLMKKYPVKIGSGAWDAIPMFRDLLLKYPASVPTKNFVNGKMQYPLHVKKIPGGFIAWMDHTPNTGWQADDTVDWVKSTGPGKKDFTFGINWATPVPQN